MPKQCSFLLPKEADNTQDILDVFSDDDDHIPASKPLGEIQQSKQREKLDDDDISTQMFDDYDKEISFKKSSVIPNRRDSCQDKSMNEKYIDFFFATTQPTRQECSSSILNAPTQLFQEDQFAPTQQFTGTTLVPESSHAGPDRGVCEDDDDDIDEALFDEPTQSFASKINKKTDNSFTQKFEDDMLALTQLFKTPSFNARKVTVFKKNDEDDISTQLFDDDELPPTQVFKAPSTKVFDDDELPLIQIFKAPSMNVFDDELPPTQVFISPSTKVNRVLRKENDDFTQKFDEGAEDMIPTQAFKDPLKHAEKNVKAITDEDIPTQVFDDDVDETPTQVFKERSTITDGEKVNIEDDMIPTQMFCKYPRIMDNNEADDAPTQVFQASLKKTHIPNFIRIIKPVDNLPSTVTSVNDFVESSESTQGSVAGLWDMSLSNIVFADSEDVTEDATTQDVLDLEPVYKDKSFGIEILKTPQKKPLMSLEDTDSESDDDQLSSSLKLFDIPPEELEESPQKSPMKATSQQKSPRRSASPKNKKENNPEDSTSADEEMDKKVTVASPVRRRSRRERNNVREIFSKSTDEVEIVHKIVGKNVTRKGKQSKSEVKNTVVEDNGHSSKNIDNSEKDDTIQSRKGRSGEKKAEEQNLKSKTNKKSDQQNTIKQKIEERSAETDKNTLKCKSPQDSASKKGKGRKSLKKSEIEDDKSSDIKAASKICTKPGSLIKNSLEKEKKNKSPEEEKHTRGKIKNKIFESDDEDEPDLSVKGSSSRMNRSNVESKKKDKGKDKEIEENKAVFGTRKTNKRKRNEAELSDNEAPNKNMKPQSKRSDQSQNESCVTLEDVNKPPARRGRRHVSKASITSSINSSNQRASSRKSVGIMQKPQVTGRERQSAVHDSDSSTAEIFKRGQGRTSAVHDSGSSAAEVPKRGGGRKSVAPESDSTSEMPKRGRGKQSIIQDSDSSVAEMPKRGQRKHSVNKSDSNTTTQPKRGKGRQSNILECDSKKGNRSLTLQEVASTVSNSSTPVDEEEEVAVPRRGSRIRRGPHKYSPSKNDSKETKNEVGKKGRKSAVEKFSISPVDKSKETLEIKELENMNKPLGSKKDRKSAGGRVSESKPNTQEIAQESTVPRKSRGRASITISEKKSEKTNKKNQSVSQDSVENSSRSRKKGNNSQELKTENIEKKSGKRPTKDVPVSDGSMKRSSSQSSIDSQASQKKRKKSRATEELLSTPKSRSSGSSKGSPYSGDSVLWSPSQRHQFANTRPKVMFTAYTDPSDEEIVSDLGGSVVVSPQECTVLVTTGIRRTCKLMATIGRGIPIVTPKWLSTSKQARNFTDPWSYLVVDKEAEKKFDFRLEKTLKSAMNNPLFKGYSLYVTKSVKPPSDLMKEIILCSGGEFLEAAPKSAHDKVIVVSCEEDKRQWGTFKKNNIPIVSSEFVLTGLLRHKILIKENKLN